MKDIHIREVLHHEQLDKEVYSLSFQQQLPSPQAHLCSFSTCHAILAHVNPRIVVVTLQQSSKVNACNKVLHNVLLTVSIKHISFTRI